jgi:glucose-1-phosphate cytidylyltransferase
VKVVLFCGGLGTRLREHSETIPKPLVPIGNEPILVHLMRYYAHYGHKEFVLCLGFGGEAIRRYFLEYDARLTNDCVLERGVATPLTNDVASWRITFVDTGLHSSIGERLLRVRNHVEADDVFLANYADGVANVRLDRQLAQFRDQDAIASFASVRLPGSFHAVCAGRDGLVTKIGRLDDADVRVNGGFFCMRREVFSLIEAGDELVEAPFERLIRARRLCAFRHEGFWRAMDTLKDKLELDQLDAGDRAPWKVWKQTKEAVHASDLTHAA